jgi:hypothetical protein
MSGQPYELLTGGAGMFQGNGNGPVAPQNANGKAVGAGLAGLQPHHGPICLVLFAVAVLFVLDRAGFRFAVTAGRR